MAKGLVLASGMHTCLIKTALPLREGGTEEGRRRGPARTCTTAPCPCLGGEVGEEKSKIKCQRCGLEGCKGHTGNVVSELIHLQYVAMVAYLVVSAGTFLYFRLFLGFLQGLFLHTFDVEVFCSAGIKRFVFKYFW